MIWSCLITYKSKKYTQRILVIGYLRYCKCLVFNILHKFKTSKPFYVVYIYDSKKAAIPKKGIVALQF